MAIAPAPDAKRPIAQFTCQHFAPSVRWKGGHWMTLYTWARRRHFPHLPAPEPRTFDVAADARVGADCYWQRERLAAPTLLALHGLEGSSAAHYMRGMADKAFARGFNVVLLNQRNCGGTEHLSRGLYHSGLASDPACVLSELRERDGLDRFAVAGYSLGGNLALRLAGEHGERLAPSLMAVCAVSPTLDLATCVKALERRENRLYQWNFVRNLRARMMRKSRAWPGVYDTRVLEGVWTVRRFDEVLTAPHHGFRDADDYYYRASALRVVDRIRVPTLIISAADDPFVPPEQFHDPAVTANPWITVVITPHGGHCGFFAEAPDGYDGYWAEQTVVGFATVQTEARM